VVSVKGGIMSANPPGRHVIAFEPGKTAETGEVLIIDDTVDSVPSEARADIFFVARREAGMIRPERSERRIWSLEQMGDREISPADVTAFFNSLAVWLPPVGYISAVLGALIFRVFQTLLYGAFTTVYARRRGLTLNLSTATRLCAVAVTPVIIIRTLLWFGPWEPAWYLRWPAAIAITAAYIALAIRAVASAPQQTGSPGPALS
jgi:hypothetical protein